MNGYAVFDGENVIPCSYDEWEKGRDERWKVALAKVDEFEVSTVFLGANHSFDEGPDLWFETMIFGPPPLGGEMDRYTTVAEARAGHAHMVNRCKRQMIEQFSSACQ